jgi:hypothetical protein
MIIRFAVICGQPAACSGSKQSAVRPAVRMYRVNEDDVALFDCDSDGRLVGRCRGDGRSRTVVVKSAEIVVEDRLWRDLPGHDLA